MRGYGFALDDQSEPWWTALGRQLQSRMPAAPMPGDGTALPVRPEMVGAQFKPEQPETLSLDAMQARLGGGAPKAEVISLADMQRRVAGATDAPKAPEPEADTRSFFQRRIGDPFRVGLQQLGIVGSAGMAGYGAERLQVLDEIDALEAAGKPQDAKRLVAGRNDLDLSQYIAEPNPIRRQEIRDRLTRTLTGGVAELAQRQENIAAIPRNPRLESALKSGSLREFGQAVVDDPGIILELTAQSVPTMAPGLGAAAVLGPLAGVGAAGFGVGGGSVAVESASALVESLQKQGVNVTDKDALATAFRDPELMARAHDYATRKGLPIAAFDALSLGLASKLMAPKAIAGRVLSPVEREVANVPAQAGQNIVTGAVGEAGGQLAAEGEITNPAEIGAEAAGGLGGVVMEAPFAAQRLRAAARETLSPEQMQERMRGARDSAGAQNTAAPIPTSPPGPNSNPGAAGSQQPGTLKVFTPAGRAIDTSLEVVEAADLVTSHDADLNPDKRYPADLQPRDRTRAASAEQIADIAGSLRPELLGPTPSATDGAPIVGPDSAVESGNARVLALRRAYALGNSGASAYRDWLASQGYNTEGMAEPVLVRRRVTELSPQDRIAFAAEANQRTTATMSASEQAGTDAKNITDDLIGLYRGGDLGSGTNAPFVRGFVEGVVPQAERGGVYTREGGLSADGLRRIENAVFARAYEDTDLLAALREDPDTNFRAIGNAMMDAAPGWAGLRAEAARGAIPRELDITPDLRAAVSLVREARRKGQPVTDLLKQGDLLSRGASPEAQAILRLMFNDDKLSRPASRQRVSGALGFYADQARKAQPGPGLFAGETKSSALDILTLARTRGQGGLFDEVLPMQGTAKMAAPISGSTSRAAESLSIADMEARIGGRTSRAAPGVAYTGFVADQVAGVSRRDPKRREAILGPLMKVFDLPLYQGRITGKGTLGFFRMPFQEVRVRRMADIETTAHEMAHALDYRIPEIRAQWYPASNANAAIRDELRGVSYDASKLYEGFAEFVRLWATQKNQAQAKAPQFYQWFESFLDRNKKYGPPLRKAQKEMHEWFEQDAVTRARSKIGEPERQINEHLNSWWDRFRQNVSDDLHGIMQAERRMTGDLAPAGPYETARLTRAAGSIAEGALLYGAPVVQGDGSHKFVGKGLKEILDPVADRLDDALLYFVGRSASELMGQNRERLFTKAEIQGMLALETPEFRRAFQEYQDWNKRIVDFAESKGLIDPGFRAKWKRAAYLPFHRTGTGGNFEQVTGDWKGIKALTGGTENIRDVLENMIGNATMLIKAALVNEARFELVRLSNQPGGARLMAEIPREDRIVRIHRNEIAQAIMEALGARKAGQLTPEQSQVINDIVQGLAPMVALAMRGQAPLGRNVISVLESGKPRYFEVEDPLLYRAMLNLNRPTQQGVVKVLNQIRRFGQATITLTADFMAANFVRDQFMGGIMSRHGFRPFVDGARGIVGRVRSDQAYRDYVANGGGLSSYMLDDTAFRKHMEQFYTQRGIDYRTVLDAPSKLLYGIERLTDAFEMATRIGEYKRAIAKGAHPRHAAYSAREVSTGFRHARGLGGLGVLPRLGDVPARRHQRHGSRLSRRDDGPAQAEGHRLDGGARGNVGGTLCDQRRQSALRPARGLGSRLQLALLRADSRLLRFRGATRARSANRGRGARSVPASAPSEAVGGGSRRVHGRAQR